MNNLLTTLDWQSTAIRVIINHATEPEDLDTANDQIAFTKHVWAACGYAYKTKELVVALAAKATALIASESVFLNHLRKNASCRRGVERGIARLTELARVS